MFFVFASLTRKTQEAIDAFNLFSGRAVIGCGTCSKSRGKKQQRQRRNYDMEDMESNASKLPPLPALIPIGTRIYEPQAAEPEYDGAIDDVLIFSDDEDLRAPIPTTNGIGKDLPALVPIAHHYGRKKHQEDNEDQIESKLPALIPIGHHYARKKHNDDEDEYMGNAMPPLAPLSSAVAKRAPSLNDFL